MRPTFIVLVTGISQNIRYMYERVHDTVLQSIRQEYQRRGSEVYIGELDDTSGRMLFGARGVILCLVGDLEPPDDIGSRRSPRSRRSERSGPPGSRNERAAKRCERLMEAYGPAAEHLLFYIGDDFEAAADHIPYSIAPGIVTGRRSLRRIGGGIEQLARTIHRDLSEILQPVPAGPTDTPFLRIQHDNRADAYASTAVPIPGLLNRLTALFESDSVPILVTGPPRVGKSILLALWGRECARLFPDAVVIRHFVEEDGPGSDHGLVLHHLLSELIAYGLATGPVPNTLEDMQEMFHNTMTMRHAVRIIVIIDALDELAVSSQNLQWLPWRPASAVRLVLSATPSTAADHALGRGWRSLVIGELPIEIRDELERRSLRRSIPAAGTADPAIYYDDDLESMTQAMLLPEPESTVRYILDHALRSGDDAADLREMLQRLCGSRRGLTEVEICDLMGITSRRCAELIAAVGPLIIRHGALMVFDHGTTRSVVERYVLAEPRAARRNHEDLAEFFSRHPRPERRAEEVPWQCARANAWPRLRACIEDLTMFADLVSCGRSYELLEYWRQLGDTGAMAETYRSAVDRWLTGIRLSPESAEKVIVRLEQLGGFLGSCAQYDASGRNFQRAEELRIRFLPLDRAGLARLRGAWGETLRLAGQYDRSIGVLRQALNDLRDLPDADQVVISQTVNDLGLAMRDAGDQSALEYLCQALNMRERHPGPRHPSTAETLNDLALFHLDRQQSRTAIMLLGRAVDIMCPEIGDDGFDPESPALATYLHNLASARYGVGHHATAMTLLIQALDIRERLLGVSHHYTLVTRVNLAVWYYRAGRTEEARELCEQAQRDMADVLKEEHPHYLAATVNLAQLIQEFDGNGTALTMLFETLGVSRRMLPPDHWITVSCLYNLARLLYLMARYAEAEQFAEEASAVWEAASIPDGMKIATGLVMLGMIQERTGRDRQAADRFERALALREAVLGPRHGRTLDAHYRLALVLERIGPRGKACAVMTLYLERHPDAEHETVRDIMARAERLGCAGHRNRRSDRSP